MGDEHVQGALGVEDDAVGTGGAAGVDGAGRQDGELVPGLGGGEVEALVVVVLVGVLVCCWWWFVSIVVEEENGRQKGKKKKKHTASNLSTSLVITITLVQGRSDGRRGVAHGAAGVLASLGLEVARGLDGGLNGELDVASDSDGLNSRSSSSRDGGAGDGNDREEGDEGGEELDHFDCLWRGGDFGGMR